jgi:NAD(P)H-hydrate repair Nnr-like enzyme with NAD(P)H-hydrate epimerase domain
MLALVAMIFEAGENGGDALVVRRDESVNKRSLKELCIGTEEVSALSRQRV